MIRTLWNLVRVDPGFGAESVMTLRLQVSPTRYPTPGHVNGFYRQLFEKIDALPGVIAAGAVQHLPLSGFTWSTPLEVEGARRAPDRSPPTVGWRVVEHRYFGAMDIPLVAGRTFDDDDRRGGTGVTIVNDVLARRFFGGVPDAVGHRLAIGPQRQIVTIVGVVRAVWELDRQIPIANLTPFDTRRAESVGCARLIAVLLIAFAAAVRATRVDSVEALRAE